MFPVPIVLIVFRRPDLTRRVVDLLAALQPQTLFVVADGPRRDHPEDAALCAQTRAVVDNAPWKGAVFKNYSDVNLGCGQRPATGISWAFSQVEQAIILEDDCLPHPSFFRYCEEMLERYRDDTRVMHIAGTNYRREPIATAYSYCFSQMCAAWGWATWRRAWQHFDAAVPLWPQLRDTSWLAEVLPHEGVERFWADSFERAHVQKGQVSYWDHQWAFACWANSGLAVVPRHNLVSNLGCNPQGTHCASQDDILANLPAFEMSFPLSHPPTVLHSREMDRVFVREKIAPRLFPPKPSLPVRMNKWGRRIVGGTLRRLGLRARGRPAASAQPAAAAFGVATESQ